MDENILIEKKYNITTEKNNKMDLYIRYYDNEEISISIYSINKIPSVKYELRSNLEEFQKNRFFKIFNNIEELIIELDSKIEKTTILEETNLLILDIPIGLKIINDILLEIKIVEKTPTEIIEELIEFNNKLKMKVENLEKNIAEKDNKIEQILKLEQILKQNKELNEENQKLKNEINNNNDNFKDLKLNLENLQIKLNNYENQKISLNKLITEKDFEQIYNKLDEEINLGNVINLDLFKIKINELIKNEKEKYDGVKKDDIINELKNKIVNIIL